MSWEHWIIGQEESRQKIRETLRAATKVLEKSPSVDRQWLALHGQLFDIRSNKFVRDVVEEQWTWSSEQYLWVTNPGARGGIDIEVEHIDDRFFHFLEEDMSARGVDAVRQTEVLRRARDGVRYRSRLSFFQDPSVHVVYLAVTCALAESMDAYVYTTDAGWLASVAPVNGSVLKSHLLDPNWMAGGDSLNRHRPD